MMVGLGILNVRTGPSCLRSKLDRHGVLELGWNGWRVGLSWLLSCSRLSLFFLLLISVGVLVVCLFVGMFLVFTFGFVLR